METACVRKLGQRPDIVQWPGPDCFEVVYAPWDIGGGVRVAETRRVTLDAGNRFSKVRSVLNVRGTETVKAGVGMDTGKRRNDYEAVMEDRESGGLMTAWSRPRKDDGCLGTAVIVPWVPEGRAVDTEGCTYLLRKVANGEPLNGTWGRFGTRLLPFGPLPAGKRRLAVSGSASAILCKSGCGRSRRILLFLAERVAASFCYGCGGAGMGSHSASVSGWRGAGVSARPEKPDSGRS